MRAARSSELSGPRSVCWVELNLASASARSADWTARSRARRTLLRAAFPPAMNRDHFKSQGRTSGTPRPRLRAGPEDESATWSWFTTGLFGLTLGKGRFHAILNVQIQRVDKLRDVPLDNGALLRRQFGEGLFQRRRDLRRVRRVRLRLGRMRPYGTSTGTAII